MNTAAMNPDLAQALARVVELEAELSDTRAQLGFVRSNLDTMIATHDEQTDELKMLRGAVRIAVVALDSVQSTLDDATGEGVTARELTSAGHELGATRRALRGAL